MKMLHRQSRVKRPELRPSLSGFLLLTLLLFPLAAHAQSGSSPFDTGLTSIQTLFTGTIAKVSSLIAIVIGGYAFAHGDGYQHPDLALGFLTRCPRHFVHVPLTREGLYERTHTKTPKSGLQGSA
jgi:type IV secretory pathway VirB2 component (pilin)